MKEILHLWSKIIFDDFEKNLRKVKFWQERKKMPYNKQIMTQNCNLELCFGIGLNIIKPNQELRYARDLFF